VASEKKSEKASLVGKQKKTYCYKLRSRKPLPGLGV